MLSCTYYRFITFFTIIYQHSKCLCVTAAIFHICISNFISDLTDVPESIADSIYLVVSSLILYETVWDT